MLEKMIRDRQRLATDAGVSEEILKRYVSINRRDAIQPAFDLLLVTDQVDSVDERPVALKKS